MNINKETIGQFAAKMKEAFASFNAVVKLMSAKLADGKQINIQGESLAQGVVVTVMTEAGEAPLPDGEYTLEDGTVFVVSGGSVSEVKAPAATENPEMNQNNPAPQASTPTPTQVIERIEKELVFQKEKTEGLEKSVNSVLEKFAALEKENAELKAENVKFSKVVKDMDEALALFAEQPQVQKPGKVDPPEEKKKETIEEYRARVFATR